MRSDIRLLSHLENMGEDGIRTYFDGNLDGYLDFLYYRAMLNFEIFMDNQYLKGAKYKPYFIHIKIVKH